jgi:sphingosine kinase
MGDTRFVVGYIKGALMRRVYPCEVHLRIVYDNKAAIVSGEYPRREAEDSRVDEGLPPLRYGTVKDPLPLDDGWTRIEKPTVSFYAGAHRLLISRPSSIGPERFEHDYRNVTVPRKGFASISRSEERRFNRCDIPLACAAKRVTSGQSSFQSGCRLRALLTGRFWQSMDGADKGRHIDRAIFEYLKVDSYRLVPLGEQTNFVSIDGEHVPCEPFQVEVHPRLAHVLSLEGTLWKETPK